MLLAHAAWAPSALAQSPTFGAPSGVAAATRAADAQSAVPALPYRSVFSDLPTGVEDQQDGWAKANAEVGQFRRGHVDLLKWEQEREKATDKATPGKAMPGAATPAHSHAH